VLKADQLTNIRGELSCQRCNLGELFVELRDPIRSMPSERIGVSPSGDFELRSIRGGYYVLHIVSSYGEPIQQEQVHVSNITGPLRIRIAEAKQNRPVSGLISAARLSHKVPKAARKAYDRSHRSLEKKDVEASLKHLQEAVTIDPEYFRAWNNLGSRLVMLNRPEEAITAFQKALRLDPSESLVHANLAVALMQSRRFPEAEKEARASLASGPDDVKARYVLGLSLYAQRRFTAETISMLEGSVTSFQPLGVRWILLQCKQTGSLTR